MAAPAPIFLQHPTVLDTAHLKSGETVVRLFGVQGIAGDPAHGLQAYIAANGDSVTCHQQPGSSDAVCQLPGGMDLAMAALLNGAAQTTQAAPASYHEQETAAQAARRGIWVSLPPPPVIVQHPIVQTTAELVADNQAYVLDGLIGFGVPYTDQMKGYIAGNGDSLSCQEQPANGHFICVLPDGTDIATVALLNGAARVAPDASNAYREAQGKAIDTKRGFWYNPPHDILVAALEIQQEPDAYVVVPGDIGDGIAYVDGTPTAVIEGETVFLTFAGVAGWGYYDHFHTWHGAPDRFRDHLERFHPEGRGLRGFDHGGAFRHDAAFREPGFRGSEGLRGGEGFRGGPGFHGPEGVHGPEGLRGGAGFHGPEGVHGPEGLRGGPGFHGPEGVRGGPGQFHGGPEAVRGEPGRAAPGGFAPRPGVAPGGMAGRPAAIPASAGGFRPGGAVPSGAPGGFRPGGAPAVGGFHPAAAAAPRPMAAPARAAPAAIPHKR